MRLGIAGYTLDADVKRTRDTYARIDRGNAEVCGCQHCRNYLASIPYSLPAEVVAFLSSAGVDLHKDAEVYEMGEETPGVFWYGGEYYLWGTILSRPSWKKEFPMEFGFEFTPPSGLQQDEFCDDGAVCFLFLGKFRWVLEGEKPEYQTTFR